MCPPPTDPVAPRPLDGGWGWVVVACSFLAMLLGYGSPLSLGVLYPEWLLMFGEGKAMTAWVGSLVVGVGLLVGPFCGVCVVNFGPRPVAVFSGVMVAGGFMLSAFAPNISFLIFSYGLVVGVGDGLLYAAIVVIVCLYFDKKRGLALGIMQTGSSVGGVLFATLQRELIQLYGVDGGLLVVGALALNVVPFAGLMRPLTLPKYYLRQRAAILERAAEEQRLHEDEEAEPSNQKPSAKDATIKVETKEPLARSLSRCSDFMRRTKIKIRHYSQCLSSMLSLLQDRVLLALCVSLLLYCLGNLPPQLFLEDLAQSYGLTDGVSSISLVSLNLIGSSVGKLGLGIIADVPRVNSVLLYALTVGVSGLGVLLIPLARSHLDLQVLSVILGFMTGTWTLTPYVTVRVVGAEKLAEAHGILMFFGGVGLMMGPPVVGSFYDFTQSYDVAFFLSGSCMMAGSLALILAFALRRKQTPPPEAEPISCSVTTATDADSPVS